MEVKYRILSVDPKEHSFIVRYYTDVLTEDILANDFDHIENPDGSVVQQIRRTPQGYPTKCRTDMNLTVWSVSTSIHEIEELIKRSAPISWFELQETIHKDETNAVSQLSSIIGKELSFEYIKHAQEPELTHDEIQELLRKL